MVLGLRRLQRCCGTSGRNKRWEGTFAQWWGRDRCRTAWKVGGDIKFITWEEDSVVTVAGSITLVATDAITRRGVLRCCGDAAFGAGRVSIMDEITIHGSLVVGQDAVLEIGPGAVLDVSSTMTVPSLTVSRDASVSCGDLVVSSSNVCVDRGGRCVICRGSYAAAAWEACVQGSVSWTSASCAGSGKVAHFRAFVVDGTDAHVTLEAKAGSGLGDIKSALRKIKK